MRAAPPFIAFEGGDGAGKSTQARLLTERLRRDGHDVLLTFEPGDSELGRSLREAVLHGEDIDARTEALLYAADRAHHVHSIVGPALAAGRTVVTDRYIDSSVAYQGAARGLGEDRIAELSRWATAGLVPDLTILLDIDTAAAGARRDRAPDRLEREAAGFHSTVREAFLALTRAAPHRYAVVDAGGRLEAVAETVTGHVARLLAERAAAS